MPGAASPVATPARSFPWSALAGKDTNCSIPVRSGRLWVQPVGTTGSVVVLDVSRPEEPVIVDELGLGIDARPHWLALEPGRPPSHRLRDSRDPVPPADLAVGIQQPPAQAALMQRILSQRGAEGWELVTVGEDFGSTYFYVKRPK